VDVSWTSHGRGGGRQRETAGDRETGVSRASTTGTHGVDFSYRFGAAREEVVLGNGAMRLHSRSGDHNRAGSSDPFLVR
jgi:hypothetical protein